MRIFCNTTDHIDRYIEVKKNQNRFRFRNMRFMVLYEWIRIKIESKLVLNQKIL